MTSAALAHPRYWGTWLGIGLLRVAVLLPLPVLAAVGSMLGLLLYYLHPTRRRIVAVNLAHSFPQLAPRPRRRVARQHFRALGQGLFDAAIVWWASVRRLRRLVHFEGREHYDRALAQGRPIILLAPHFVAMEVGGVFLSSERPVATMYKKTKNAAFNSLLRHARVRFGGQIIERGEGLKPALRALKAGRVFYYLPDQDLGREHSVFAPFFGVSTATVPALGRLAQLTGAVVIPCFTRQRAWGGGYDVIFAPPLTDFPTGDAVDDATRTNEAIERGVALMPAQYFWVHKRFKTRPEGEADFYARAS
jgi:lipid A biosynthesis lauroyl/palmitoleoyl acyltransferase